MKTKLPEVKWKTLYEKEKERGDRLIELERHMWSGNVGLVLENVFSVFKTNQGKILFIENGDGYEVFMSKENAVSILQEMIDYIKEGGK